MFKYIKNDLPSSVVVFFVALPLCLGIALASGAPLFSGLIAGIIGGVLVGALSGSHTGVSGPAAGLAAIVLVAIGDLGGYENFLLAVVLGGIFQLLLGILKAGVIGYFFPSSVIKGMLTGIGIIIILKQIPHFFGYNKNPENSFSFFQIDGKNTFTEIINSINYISPGATLIAVIGLIVILFWDNILSKKGRFFRLLQGPFIAVILGVIYYLMTKGDRLFGIEAENMVKIPVADSFDAFKNQFTLPNFSVITDSKIWITAFTIALVASLETLLCVEAADKIDTHKRITPTNKELIAQGVGNIVSGLIGGLPITQVIVRSSANVQSGARTKLSTILHGILLLISVAFIPNLLNKIPLSVLAAVLLVVGYKLAKPAVFKKMWDIGWKQFVPFIITVLGIIFTDLLIGVILGLVVGILITLIKSYQNSHFLHIKESDGTYHNVKMRLAEEVTFFNKAAIMRELESLPKNTHLEIDIMNTRYLDQDVIEVFEDFITKAQERNINIILYSKQGTAENPSSFIDFFNKNPKSDLSLN